MGVLLVKKTSRSSQQQN